MAPFWKRPECWIFVVAVVVRTLILSRFAASPHFLPETDDMKFYTDWAIRILHGQWTDGKAFYGLPGYAFCLAAIFSVTGINPFAVGMIQVILEAVTALLVFKIAKESFFSSQNRDGMVHGAAIACLAALGWVFFLPAQTFSVILMPTAWVVAAFWFCVWWLARRQSMPARPWLWFAFGGFIGAVATMVATILFLLPLCLLAIVMQSDASAGWRSRARGIGLAAALLATGVALGTSPAWVHNCFIARDPVLLSAHSGLNFWMGNNPDATGYPKIPEGLSAGQEGLLRDSITRAETSAGRKLKRSEVSEYWSGKANAWVGEHRGEWLVLLSVKLRNFWSAFQYDDLSEITLLREEGVLTPGLNFGWVATLGLPGMLAASGRFRRARWIAAAIALHLCALLSVFITERYRLCAVPGLMIFAAFALVEVFSNLARRRWQALAGWSAAVGLAACLVYWPQRDLALSALEPFNTGLKYLRTGRLDLAQSKLERARQLAPDNPEINFGLGNLWYAKHELNRARAFYRRTIELAPKHTGALNNLAHVETLERQWEMADRLLRASIALDPDSARAHFLMAELEYARADLNAARLAVARALELRPNQPELLALQKKLGEPATP